MRKRSKDPRKNGFGSREIAKALMAYLYKNHGHRQKDVERETNGEVAQPTISYWMRGGGITDQKIGIIFGAYGIGWEDFFPIPDPPESKPKPATDKSTIALAIESLAGQLSKIENRLDRIEKNTVINEEV